MAPRSNNFWQDTIETQPKEEDDDQVVPDLEGLTIDATGVNVAEFPWVRPEEGSWSLETFSIGTLPEYQRISNVDRDWETQDINTRSIYS